MGFADLMETVDRAVLDSRLGDEITYTPGVGAAVDVAGCFDSLYVRVEAGGQAGISSSGPAVFLRLDDLPSDPVTDTDATVTVDGVTYSQHEAQPDGLGGVVLLLHRV